MNHSTRGLLFASALVACSRVPEPVPAQAPADEPVTGPRLAVARDRWFLTGLSPDAASLVEQGRMFAVQRPIPETDDSEAVAVVKALDGADGRTVKVAPHCVVPGAELQPDMRVEALASGTSRKVGPCLARVVETGTGERGEAFVVLDVGSGLGVETGDQYVLLGQPVTLEGHVPLVLDTHRNGLCQIPADPRHLTISTARCEIVVLPHGVSQTSELRRSFAAWMAR